MPICGPNNAVLPTRMATRDAQKNPSGLRRMDFLSDDAWSWRSLDCSLSALPEKLETSRFYPDGFAVRHPAGIWITNEVRIMKFRRVGGYRTNPTALRKCLA